MASASSSKRRPGPSAHAATVSATIALVLAACLPFLAPFDPTRNTDFQGLILLIIGAFSWLAVGLRRRVNLAVPMLILLGIYALSCVVSLLVNPHPGYDFFGAPYIRLGAAGLLACVGFGLAVQSVPVKRFVPGLYGLICALALASVPYSWLHVHSLLRLGGTFLQADIFAVFMGCGLLLGAYLLRIYPRFRYQLLAGQGLLTSLLLLSGTRSVLLLLVLIYPLWQQRAYGGWRPRTWLAYAVCVLALVLGTRVLLPARVTNTAYAAESVHYRLNLQRAALETAADKPLAGYGPGNLADALDCRRLREPDLQQTCSQGFFFNSSHDIFLDRALAVGWLGGLSYLLFVVLAIARGFRRPKHVPVEAACALLIAAYYLTNVTSAALELVFWVFLLRIAASRVSASR